VSNFWTVLKMSNFHFPFGFLEKSCYWKMDKKYSEKYVTKYDHIFCKPKNTVFLPSKKK
jgi:hypothetical protein